jgi:hypothetical protein
MQVRCPNDGSVMLETGRLGTSGCWSETRMDEEITQHDIVSPPVHYAFVPVPPMTAAGHHEAEYVFTRTCPTCGLVQAYIRHPERIRVYADENEQASA